MRKQSIFFSIAILVTSLVFGQKQNEVEEEPVTPATVNAQQIYAELLGPGVAFAWIFIVMTFPVLGICLYVLIGDRPVGRKLTRKITRMNREYSKITEEMRTKYAVDKQLLPIEARYFGIRR